MTELVAVWPASPDIQVVSPATGGYISVDGETVPATRQVLRALRAGDLLPYDPAEGADALVYVPGLSGTLGLLVSQLETMVGLYPNQVVTCVGGDAAGDGDEGQFQWRSDSGASENGYDVIQVGTRPGRWHRISSGGGSGNANEIHGLAIPEPGPGDVNVALVRDLSGNLIWDPKASGVLVFDVTEFGAVGDGASHPLSSVYGSLAAAQAVYPFATSLTQELDYCGIQAAINAACSNAGRLGGIVWFPRPAATDTGRYRLNAPLVVQNCTGISLEGPGVGTSILSWVTATADQAILVDGVRHFRMRRLKCYRSSGTLGKYVRTVARTSPSYPETTLGYFEDVVFENASGTSYQHCISFECGGTYYVERTNGGFHRESAYYIANGSHVDFRSSGSAGWGTSPRGKMGIWCNGGSFSYEGAGDGGGYHGECDIRIGPLMHTRPISISMLNAEDSYRALVIGDPDNPSDAVGPPIMVSLARLDMSGSPPLDGRFIAKYNASPLLLEGIAVGFGSSGEGQLPPRIYLGDTSGLPTLTLHGNSFQILENIAGWVDGDSGAGTKFIGPIEYPDTWAAPPAIYGDHTILSPFESGAVFKYMPNVLAVRGLGKWTVGKVASNFVLRGTLSGGVQEVLIPFDFGEVDTNFAPVPSIEVLSGTAPDNLTVTVKTKATGACTVRLSHAASTFSVAVTILLVRYG